LNFFLTWAYISAPLCEKLLGISDQIPLDKKSLELVFMPVPRDTFF